ncbi:MAG: MASE1 domain-containing protein [Rubrimonas sp.]|uniref:sensor histidine kinase n=1 Tax=Rubrimonas sp. TaxID=2036015 RepID=UPI002FDEDC0A
MQLTTPVRDDAKRPAGVVPEKGRPHLGDAAAIVAWSIAWVALWKLAEILAVNHGVSAWYPPAAISLFLTIRYGAPAAPAVFAASFVAGSGQWAGYPDHWAVLGSLAHAVAYLAAGLLYRSQVRTLRQSIRPKTLAMLMVAAFLGSALSSALGNVNAHLATGGEDELSIERLLGWAVGDLFGALSLAPVLLFAPLGPIRSRAALRRAAARLRAPLAALGLAVALASVFAAIAGGSELNVRLLCVVGVGVFSVIAAYAASPKSAVIYLFLISAIAAAWLSTDAAPSGRIEFAFQISTFLLASFAMIALSMARMRERAAAAIRRLRIHELSEQRDALTRRIAAVEAEFAQLAHEFKTPLGGIIGLLDITENGMETGAAQDQVSKHLKYMRGCAWYLNAMVDDAFDIARIARGQFEPAIAEFDLVDLLHDLAAIARAKIGDDAAFPTELEGTWLSVRSDRNRLLQILINLVVNAARYSDRRGTVRVLCSLGPESATITVENEAAAVTKEMIDGYIEGGRGVAVNSKGLGIGLPLVGKLAAGIGAQLSTQVEGGVVAISVTVPRA